MKKHLMTAVCILLAAACVCLSAALVLTARDDAQTMGTTPGLANASSDDIQFKLALLHLYKEATDVTLVLPYTTSRRRRLPAPSSAARRARPPSAR